MERGTSEGSIVRVVIGDSVPLLYGDAKGE